VQVTENGNILFEGLFSTEPNPTRPHPLTHIKWPQFGARIKSGTYRGEVIDGKKGKHGAKYIYLYNHDGGIEIPTLDPDVNNGGRYVAKGVLIHTGWSNDWPGTTACQSIPPAGAEMFWSLFEIGEKIQYNLRRVV
jgi:hypothetical protein